MRPLAMIGLVALAVALGQAAQAADDMRPVALAATITEVQPMTGIALWTTNPDATTEPIQLEYCYLAYRQVVDSQGRYDWAAVDEVLRAVATRKHQAILRWHDTYVGKPTGVPDSIKALPDYRETTATSEGKPTGFPDWSHPAWQAFVLEFFTRFAARYDHDPRLAFVQVGFGLWAEYHIYDGPMELGETFPSLEFQGRFFEHLATCFRETPWMISVDAAGSQAALVGDPRLLALRFGVFDDSFNHRRHAELNEPNWKALGPDRWKTAPAGGEFSFFSRRDQKQALAPAGPYGIPFEEQAARFHVSFIIGDDQPRFQTADRIRAAGLACGYRFRVTRFAASATASEVVITNVGIAPIYHAAFPTVNGVRSLESLAGLLPGASKRFMVEAGGRNPTLTIESDRLVPGQRISYETDDAPGLP